MEPTIDIEKARRFRALHQSSAAFIIPNPWDIGSAKILEGLGFEALATTSAGFAWSQGLNDGLGNIESTLAHCRDLCSNTSVPISADLGIGFGESPEAVQQCVEAAIGTGLAGCSIEDTPIATRTAFALGQSVERIQAAREICDRINPDFVLTARCEGFAYGGNDFEDTLSRLEAYANAGADVLYAPGMTDSTQIRALNDSVDQPMNVLIGFSGMSLGFRELEALGIKRVSVGLQLARVAYGAAIHAAKELMTSGQALDSDVRSAEIGRHMA